jgi:hypothetical protein
MYLFGDLILLAAMFTVYDFNTGSEDMKIQGVFGQVHPSDFVSIGERGLFGGSVNDDESNDDSIIGNLPQPSQRDQGEDTSGNGTPSITIDPASSESLAILSQRISTDESLDDPFIDINGEIQNVGDNSLDFVRATATFYDEANSILGSAFAYTEPTKLEPGQTAPYKITAGFGDNIPVDDIASIKLGLICESIVVGV